MGVSECQRKFIEIAMGEYGAGRADVSGWHLPDGNDTAEKVDHFYGVVALGVEKVETVFLLVDGNGIPFTPHPGQHSFAPR